MTAAPDDAKEGGELNVLAAGDIDYMDPGAAYYQFTYMVTRRRTGPCSAGSPTTSRSRRRTSPTSEPEISEDGKTITFTIRDGVRFSPPVDREVTAADVKYAIERSLLPGRGERVRRDLRRRHRRLRRGREGGRGQPDRRRPRHQGVTAPDDRTLESSSTAAEGRDRERDRQALSLPVSAPVPEEYAKEFDAENPSTYGENVAFTGPYMVENDPETGELTGYTPGKEIKLVRNPNWDPRHRLPSRVPGRDHRPGGLRRHRLGVAEDPRAATAQVNGDFPPPPAVLKQAAQEREPDQIQLPDAERR